MGLLLLLLFFLIATATATRCNANDATIHRAQGATFPRRFRALGGLFVSTAEFVASVSHITGLSKRCASCFGDIYDCTWDNCKYACMSEGPKCTHCLRERGCSAALEACTGGWK